MPSNLVSVDEVLNPVFIDLKYGTSDNFTGEILYTRPQALLQEATLKRLKKVQNSLNGLTLYLWDCYRPFSVQEKLWSHCPDDRYIGRPVRDKNGEMIQGSRHNRGAAVDLTLADSQGNILEMPTYFDDFSEKAHRNYQDLSPKAIQNRALLENAMIAQGFLPHPNEWWHFDDPEWESFPLMDTPKL